MTLIEWIILLTGATLMRRLAFGAPEAASAYLTSCDWNTMRFGTLMATITPLTVACTP